MATLWVHFKSLHFSDHSRLFHLDRLREEGAQGFTAAISNRFTVLEYLMNPVDLWDSFKHEILDAAQESIGERPMTRQNFILLEILEVICMSHGSTK